MINQLDLLKEYGLLESISDEELKELVQIAAITCYTPFAFVTALDGTNAWIKASEGIEQITCVNQRDSFCQYALNSPERVLVVKDSLADKRFYRSPLVNEPPHIRFYAGAPLVTPDGNVIGTLCVLDDQPREITQKQKEALQILAKKVMDHLNIRKRLNEQKIRLENHQINLLKLTDKVNSGIFQLRILEDGSQELEFVSKGMIDLHPNITYEDWFKDPTIGLSYIHPEDRTKFNLAFQKSIKENIEFYHEYRFKKGQEWIWLSMNAEPERAHDGSVMMFGCIMDISHRKEYETTLEQISFDISHVLRRPVSSLLGLMQLLEEQEIIKPEVAEYIEHVKTVSFELDDFTRKLNAIYGEKKKNVTYPTLYENT